MKSIFSKILYVLVLLAVSLPAMAQRNVITGVVYDESGLPLTGASVIVEGTNRGVTTDSYGKYRIEAAPEEALIFNFLGYRSQKFKVGASTVLNAEMVPESQILDELVVVGYGVQKKVNVTGSVSTVDYEELSQSRPATTTSGLLQGVSAGLYVSQTSGKPGSEGVSMRIRGVGTLNDAAPLVIVDGFEGTINNVNPQDIASISVLKDAASCAIYGNRGANGVILITTKTAKEGRFNIEYTGMVAYQEPEHYFDVISNYADYMEIMNESAWNVGKANVFSQTMIDLWREKEKTPNGIADSGYPNYVAYPNVDWMEAIFTPSVYQKHSISASGSTERIKYLMSVHVGVVYEQSGCNRQFGRDANLLPAQSLVGRDQMARSRGTDLWVPFGYGVGGYYRVDDSAFAGRSLYLSLLRREIRLDGEPRAELRVAQ